MLFQRIGLVRSKDGLILFAVLTQAFLYILSSQTLSASARFVDFRDRFVTLSRVNFCFSLRILKISKKRSDCWQIGFNSRSDKSISAKWWYKKRTAGFVIRLPLQNGHNKTQWTDRAGLNNELTWSPRTRSLFFLPLLAFHVPLFT